jgi:hypothetical protein
MRVKTSSDERNVKRFAFSKKVIKSWSWSLVIVGAITYEWLLGTACTTPQVIREVQTAEPLAEGRTAATVSGGLSWAPTGVYTYGVPNSPNGDLSILIRHGKASDREFQVPISLSQRLTPGPDTEMPYGWFASQFSMGTLWKQSVPMTGNNRRNIARPSDNGDTNSFFLRQLYTSKVIGPQIGFLATNNEALYEGSSLWSALENDSYYVSHPMLAVFPYTGVYYKTIHERYLSDAIRMYGFFSYLNIYYMVPDLREFPPNCVEVLGGGFVGSEREWGLFQFTFGLGWQHLYGPKLFIGTTFSSKPKREKS